MSTAPVETVKVCIIGGGPTGIIYLKELVDAGIHSVRVIEAQKTSGGLYRDCYEDAMLTTSNPWITFSKFHKIEPIHMYTHEYADYCDEFVDKFELSKFVSFETVATKCLFDKANNTWTVECRSQKEGGAVSRQVVVAEYLVVATGLNSPVAPSFSGMPKCAKIPGSSGLPSFENFEGKVIHSSEYRKSNVFEGKRVLIVGAGESGSDIALTATQSGAKSVAVSVRGVPGHISPRSIGKAEPSMTRKIQQGNGNWMQKHFPLGPGFGPVDLGMSLKNIGSPRSQWLPCIIGPRVSMGILPLMLPFDDDPIHPLEGGLIMMGTNLICGLHNTTQYGTKTACLGEALGEGGASIVPGIQQVKPQSIVFVNGTELEVDLVVLCTGFKTTFPFLEEESPQAIKDFNPRKLWKHMIHQEYGERLVFGGFVRPGLGSIPQLSEMQARVYSQLIVGNISLPEEKELVQTIASDAAKEETCYISSKDLPPLTHFVHYSSDMAALIGKSIDYRKLLVTEPKLFLRLVYTQYNVVRFHIDETKDESLRYNARNRFPPRSTDPILNMDIHVWLVCLALTTLVDIPALSLPGVMPPTRNQRMWAWITLPIWWPLLVPSLYEFGVMWIYALATPYTWVHFYKNMTRGADNREGDMFWAVTMLKKQWLRWLVLYPFGVLSLMFYIIASTPIAIAQKELMNWAFEGEC